MAPIGLPSNPYDGLNAGGMVAVNVPQTGRKMRRPKHTFQVRHRPYVIQPFLIAPVLPGDTLKKGLLQSRAVLDPIKNPLIGWWLEYYFFYVKLSDLRDWELFQQMLLDENTNTTPAKRTTHSRAYYTPVNGMDYVGQCLERVIEEYFRDEGEAWNVAASMVSNPDAASGSSATAKAFGAGDNWLDSLQTGAAPAADPNVDYDMDAQYEPFFRMWQKMLDAKLIDMTYEQWLRTHGVSIPEAEAKKLRRPELLRFVREWTYPVNTVNPSTGTPSSAASWAVTESMDKDRLFKEPGFVFGCTLARPKVYMSAQTGAAASWLNHAVNWLPALLRNEPYLSLKNISEGSGPLPVAWSGSTEGYWVDLKDLFLYGDQYLSFDLTATDAGLVALPDAAANKSYVSSANIDALFVDAAGGKNLLRQDGVVHLHILSGIQETT